MKNFKSIAIKLIIILMFIGVVIVFTSHPVKAESFWDTVINGGDGFLDEGKGAAQREVDSASDMKTIEIISVLYNSLSTLGVIIAVAVGGAIGIKFMTSSAEDKAKVKESLVPYVIGCIVIFGAFTIWKICINIFSQI